MFLEKGKIHYDDNDGFRVTVEVHHDFIDYYRSLIPSYHRTIKPRWSSHITVVRPEKDIPPRIRYWGDYEDEEVEFMYDPYILEGNGYFWVNVWSKRLETIREELGLPNFTAYALTPVGYNKTFHITVAKYQEIFDCNVTAKIGPEP